MSKFSLRDIQQHIGGELIGDSSIIIQGVQDLENATPLDISFFSNPRYLQKMLQSQAGALIVHPDCEKIEGKNYIIHEDPNSAFQRVLQLFKKEQFFSGFTGIHETAVVHPKASIGKNVTICPHVVVDAHVTIHDNVFVGSFSYIGPSCIIHEGCIIHPHVVIREECVLGKNVIVQPGAVIGSCGYGYQTDKTGKHTKLEQFGNVTIGDDVEIGACTTIDRARFQSTSIGNGTKIDNLVQLAHNVSIGKDCLIVSQVGIAGSAKIGNHCVIAGKSAINGHIELCDQVVITACSAVSKSIKKPGVYSGVPVQPISEHQRSQVYLRRVEELFKKMEALQSKVL